MSGSKTKATGVLQRQGVDLAVNLEFGEYWPYIKRFQHQCYIPRSFFERVVRSGLCLWRDKQHAGGTRTESICDKGQQDPETEVDKNAVVTNPDNLISRFTEDYAKNHHSLSRDLRYEIRRSIPSRRVVEHPRLVSLYNSLLSGDLDHIWAKYSHTLGNVSRPPRLVEDSPSIMLLVSRCPLKWNHFWWNTKWEEIEPLMTEILILRTILPTTVNIQLMFDVEEEKCPAKIPQEHLVPYPQPKFANTISPLTDCGFTVAPRLNFTNSGGSDDDDGRGTMRRPLLILVDANIQSPLPQELRKAIQSGATTLLKLGADGTWEMVQNQTK